MFECEQNISKEQLKVWKQTEEELSRDVGQ